MVCVAYAHVFGQTKSRLHMRGMNFLVMMAGLQQSLCDLHANAWTHKSHTGTQKPHRHTKTTKPIQIYTSG